MNYQETLKYLYDQLPIFTRIGAAAYKEDLTNTIALCNALNNPQNSFKTIHIAGTNGKGSTSHLLASILQEKGLKVGLYTSPHLKDFRERIKVNGEMIDEQTVVDFVKNYQLLFDEVKPSFFEWTVALCFQYFAAQKVDIAIIETGLGGRLDSTNIIQPLLSVITNIGWDHTDLLGDTLPKIAFEKAGIIKKNVPVVVSESSQEVDAVFVNKAHEQTSKLVFAENQFTITKFEEVLEGVNFSYLNQANRTEKETICPLAGIYQKHNFIGVLAACEELNLLGFDISEHQIHNGFKNVIKNTNLMGRWQQIGNYPKIICDTGHNVNGIAFVVRQIAMQQFQHLHMVIGMVKDKEITKVLSLLPKNASYYWCKAQLPRALNEVELKQQASTFGLNGKSYETVMQALEAAKQNAQPNDFIFVGGSTFVVAEVL